MRHLHKNGRRRRIKKTTNATVSGANLHNCHFQCKANDDDWRPLPGAFMFRPLPPILQEMKKTQMGIDLQV